MENPHPQIQQQIDKHWQRLVDTDFVSNKSDADLAKIKAVLGLSDFAAETLIKSPHLIDELLSAAGQDNCAEPDYQGKLSEALHDITDEQQVMKTFRQFRHTEMTKITWRDVLNEQSIENSLKQVSALADTLIVGAYQWVYHHLCERYGVPQGEFGPQPLLILGMGKLGGRELNFSSDIDLIFTYPSSGEIAGKRKAIEHHQFFTKVAQKLISLLHQTTADGQVFRVDMRLRPFGDSGPLVTPFSALEDYYQDQGREWERYAMIKARVLNPASSYTEQLQSILKPFVFRRYLDFGAIDSLRNMKQLISQEVRRRGLHNNIKLGAGGIREVEFIVQSFQLIRGGREPGLQQAGLLENLSELSNLEALSETEISAIKTSYLFLRKVEHCLQQFNDQQTQLLPDTPRDQARLCHIMGCQTYEDLLQQLDAHRAVINNHFVSLIGEEEQHQEHDISEQYLALQDIWRLDLTEEEAEALLKTWLQDEQASSFTSVIEAFRDTSRKKGIGQKGQDTLLTLMPALLEEVIARNAEEPSALLAQCLSVISAIMGRTTYLQLLNENHGALNQLVRLCAASPWITNQIGSFPILLDELLNPAQLYHPTPLDQYHSELRQFMLRVDPDDLELQMETLRQFKLSQQLKIAAADVTGAIDIMKVSDHLTFLAEALVKEVVNIAWHQIAEKHGAPEGTDADNKGFAVVGYGKLGGIELGYGSDLDLVFVHNAQADSMTQGEKQIESARFYTKLAQRIMHLFNTKTSSGELYEIDMRLRPSGNAGLLVCHINGFNHYQLEEAWTWEHQALVRARLIYAENTLRDTFEEIRKKVICLHRAPGKLKEDVTEMRKKMRTHLSKGNEQTFDIKQDKGGIADIEFLVQFWVLSNAQQNPQLCVWSDNVRILESLEKTGIINKERARILTQCYLEYRNASHRLAIQQRQVLEDSATFQLQREQVVKIWQQTFDE